MVAEEIAQVVITASPVDNVLNLLTAFGFFRVVLPFLLIFAILYGIILKTGILGSNVGNDAQPQVKSIAAIISLATAFLVIGYSPVVSALATLIPQASFLLVVALLFLMLLSMFGVPLENLWGGTTGPKWYVWLLALPVLVIFIGIVGAATGNSIPALAGFTNFLIGAGGGINISPELMNTLIGLGIVIAIPLVVIALVIWGGGRPDGT